jgi:hypothetical protein
MLALALSLGLLTLGTVMILYERARLRADPPFPKSEGRTLYWAIYLFAIVLGLALALAAVVRYPKQEPNAIPD